MGYCGLTLKDGAVDFLLFSSAVSLMMTTANVQQACSSNQGSMDMMNAESTKPGLSL
jgi:hypothetical protein